MLVVVACVRRVARGFAVGVRVVTPVRPSGDGGREGSLKVEFTSWGKRRGVSGDSSVFVPRSASAAS